MTLLEYLESIAPEGIFRREGGVLSIDTTDFFNGWDPNVPIEQQRKRVEEIQSIEGLSERISLVQLALEAVMDGIDGYHGIYRPTETERKRLSGIELRIDPGMDEYDTGVRRPYYRMRGKSVTPEQARDIIRRTDEFVGDLTWCLREQRQIEGREILKKGDFVGTMNFNQWWFARNHMPTHFGWSHPNGLIGCNAITQRWPNFRELLTELLRWKVAFPYLDLTIAVSGWDEHPDYWYEEQDKIFDKWLKKDLSEEEKMLERADWRRLDFMKYPDFCDHLEIGVCTHDNVIEFLNPENAARRYREYVTRYGADDPDVYVPKYYEDRKLLICDNAYLIRCLTDYGMTETQAWELAESEPKYTWKDEAFCNPAYREH